MHNYKPPSFSYPGGKHYQRKWITQHFPALVTGRYVEPFAGRANVFWLASAALPCPSGWWLNDTKTADFFRALSRLTESEIIGMIGSTYPTREDYAHLSHNPSDRALLCEPWITFSGGGWGQGYRSGPKAPTCHGHADRLLRASRILQETQTVVTSLDYRDVLDSLGPDDFAYIDPPYYNCDVRSYHGGSVDYPGLVQQLRGAKFRWVLSEYEQSFYNDNLGVPVSRKTEVLRVSGRLVSSEERTEVLYRNF